MEEKEEESSKFFLRTPCKGEDEKLSENSNEVLRADFENFNETLNESFPTHTMSASLENNSIVYENPFVFCTTNARSISSKIDSLIDMFREEDASIVSISETWLKDGKLNDCNVADLEEAQQISLIVKNRARRGGGLAIAYDMRVIKLKKFPLTTKHEFVCASGNMIGTKRSVFVLSYYIPPAMTAAATREMTIEMEDAVSKAKAKLGDPIIIVSGDANKKLSPLSFANFPDLKLIDVGPTRAGASLLKCHSNINALIREKYVSAPLQSDEGVDSDHACIVCKSDIPKRDNFRKTTFTFRPYTIAGEEKFGSLLASTDWSQIMTGNASTAADKFADLLSTYTNACFPEKRRTVKSTDLPWITARFLRKVKQRKRCYKEERRSRRWKELKKESDAILLEEKEKFLEKIEVETSASGSSRNFFKAVNRLKHREAPKPWTVRDMFPGEDCRNISEKVAEHFNKISQEYTPIPKPPTLSASTFKTIEPYQISARLKTMKKPKSRLRGDIDPKLNTKFCDLLSLPLHYLYDLATKTAEWPECWKLEKVTVIPKNSSPGSLNELRNLSCTPLYSKLLESFVLEELKREVKLSESQFGGVKGSGVDYFLIESWHKILSDLEDRRAGANIVSIDFEKAFN